MQDPVIPLADSVFFLARKFLAAEWTWITRQTSNLLDDANSIFLFDSFDFLRRRLLDDDSKAFHLLSET